MGLTSGFLVFSWVLEKDTEAGWETLAEVPFFPTNHLSPSSFRVQFLFFFFFLVGFSVGSAGVAEFFGVSLLSV